MPSPFAIVGVVAGVLGLMLAASVWQLNVAWTKNGKLQQSLDTCVTRMKELNEIGRAHV